MEVKELINKELGISFKVIDKVITLLNDGATIPFIARYRKELTENLNEVQLLEIKERHSYWEDFFKRKLAILQSIESQGKLSAELRNKISGIKKLSELEDLYLPYKPKRKTKGKIAEDQGLKPLAIFIQRTLNAESIYRRAQDFKNDEIKNEEDALQGAVHILAEWISEDAWVREKIREQFNRYAQIISKVKKDKKETGVKYQNYFDYTEHIQRIAPHRILALLRAEKEGVLRIQIEADKDRSYDIIHRIIGKKYADNEYTEKAVIEAYKRILQPNFESEIKKNLKEKADKESIDVFAKNLKQLLLQPPLGSKTILAIDPGFRTGCKVSVLNNNGDFMEYVTIFPHPPQNQLVETEGMLKHLVNKYTVEAIAIGNGTAGLETEKLCRKIFKDSDVQVFSVNEAGASIYSASEIARDEFPDLDLTVRGAVSIGRRLMDPLAELVKIDAKSIGVGQYQHDVNQVLLKQKLTEIVEHCVNHVGVELNTASYPILSYISGLGTTLAKNIVKYREENGNFTERKQLLKVPKMGKKTYELSSGFLRIEGGTNPLDNTIIHPETYAIVNEIAGAHNAKVKDILDHKISLSQDRMGLLKEKYNDHTLKFILNELEKPTRDPREFLEKPVYNEISSINDLEEGMILGGKINNITNFGAFVDIGIKESGLVHISEISNTFISNIQEVIKLGQQVQVIVLEVDRIRKRIQLSMKRVK